MGAGLCVSQRGDWSLNKGGSLLLHCGVGPVGGGAGDCVVYVYINQEKKFAFVEMRTVEEASNAMALDGILFEGVAVRVRRPSDYNPTMAATLGPTQPSSSLNLAAVGLTAG